MRDETTKPDQLTLEDKLALLYLTTEPELSDLGARQRFRLITMGLARREGSRLRYTPKGLDVAFRATLDVSDRRSRVA